MEYGARRVSFGWRHRLAGPESLIETGRFLPSTLRRFRQIVMNYV